MSSLATMRARVPEALPSHPEPTIHLLLLLAQALHRYGTPADLLETTMAQVARNLCISAQFFCVPTALMVSIGEPENARTSILRVSPGQPDLEKLTQIRQLLVDLHDGKLPVERGIRNVESLLQATPRYGAAASVFSFALVSASAAIFLSGSYRDLLGSCLIGLTVGLVAVLGGQSQRVSSFVTPLSALVAAGLATLFARQVPGSTMQLMTLAGIVVLLPGFSLTVAVNELATNNLASGSARLTGAFSTFLQIGFGVAVGAKLFGWEPSLSQLGTAMPRELLPIGIVMASLGLCVSFQVPKKDFVWVIIAGVLGILGTQLGTKWMGNELGVFLGAFVLGTAAHWFERLRGKPAAILLLPGTILLVPGGVGFRSITLFLQRNTTTAIETAFAMFLTSMALVAGLLVAHVWIPRQRKTTAPLAIQTEPEECPADTPLPFSGPLSHP
jgi:uncharacterized membrane protein YjjP (DUF1212 family)